MSVFQYLLALLALIIALVSYFGVRASIVAIANSYRKIRVLWLSFRGLTPKDEIEQRVVTGKAWEEYCDALKAAGAALLGPGCPTDPFNQAEGYRYLTRLVRVTLENYMECADVDSPRFVALVNGLRDAPTKIGADNPDNLYQNASISSRYVYRIKIQRGTVHYLGFGSQSGTYGGPGGLKTVDYKEAQDLEMDGDGNIEIMVGNERPEGCKNWLYTSPESEKALIIIRQTFNDRTKEVPAVATIERVGHPTIPKPITCEFVNDALNTSAMLVGGIPLLFANWARDLQKHTNKLPLFDQEKSNKAGGDPNIRYYHSHWKLADDEALVISVTPPEVQTWNFQLDNYWMESLDYRYFKIHVNAHSASYRKDGSIRIVVAHSDPSILPGMSKVEAYDWINTVGHRDGTMCFRWIRPKSDIGLPEPQCKVIKMHDLCKSLE